MTQQPSPPPPLFPECMGCGAPLRQTTCAYCGRATAQRKTVVRGSQNHYPRLVDVELHGNQNIVSVAIRCTIVGNQNSVYMACRKTEVRGHHNRVVNVVEDPDAKKRQGRRPLRIDPVGCGSGVGLFIGLIVLLVEAC